MAEIKEHEIEWTDEQVSRLWDYYSKTAPYNSIYFTSVYAYDILQYTKKYINLNQKTILDFGSGAGHFIDEVNQQYLPKKYYALDFSPASIEAIAEKKISFELETVLGGEFPSKVSDNSVDVCFFIEVIEHLNDEYLSQSLSEIYRVLKPGGVLVLTTPNDEVLNDGKLFCPECACIFHKWQHQRTWTVNSLKRELKNFNFTAKNVQVTNLKTKNKLKNVFRSLKALYQQQKPKNIVGIFEK